jgi:hypothetical protein
VAARALVARLALAVAALAIGVWLVLQLHSTRLEEQAKASASSPPTPARVARELDLLHRAERHNPNNEPDLLEGSILLSVHRYGEAIALARRVVSQEPDDEFAQELLFAGLSRVDPKASVAVARRMRQLAPRVPSH